MIRLSRAVKDALFPLKCMACGTLFHAGADPPDPHGVKRLHECMVAFPEKSGAFSQLMAPFFCRACREGFTALESPLCSACGKPFESRVGPDHLCGNCLESPPAFGMARAVGVYNQVLLSAIHCLKFKGKVQLAGPLGLLLFSAFTRFWQQQTVDLVVPVPLHIRRFKARGYNQAFMLVRQWRRFRHAMNAGSCPFEIDRRVLLRHRWTEPQTGLGRRARLRNLKNAFGVADAAAVNKRRILLVDDVYTTGATANECAKVLLRSGAHRVDVLTLARVV